MKFITAAFAATLFTSINGTAYAGGDEDSLLTPQSGGQQSQREFEAELNEMRRRLDAMAGRIPDTSGLQKQIDELLKEIEALKNAPAPAPLAPGQPPPPPVDLSEFIARLKALENALDPVAVGGSGRCGISFGGLVSASPVQAGSVDAEAHPGLPIGTGTVGVYCAIGGMEKGDFYADVHGTIGRGTHASELHGLGGAAIGKAVSDSVIFAVGGEVGVQDIAVANEYYGTSQQIFQIGPEVIIQLNKDESWLDTALVLDCRVGVADIVHDNSGLMGSCGATFRFGIRDRHKSLTQAEIDQPIEDEVKPLVPPPPPPPPVPAPAPKNGAAVIGSWNGDE